jgi:hypothetical protein
MGKKVGALALLVMLNTKITYRAEMGQKSKTLCKIIVNGIVSTI